MTQCPSHFYGNVSARHCENCVAPCKECKGPSATLDCISCQDNSFLSGFACLSSCADGFYGAGSPENACRACDASCTLCTGASANECSKCVQGQFFLMGQSCLAVCPDGFYGNTTTSLCQQCDVTCSTCNGGNSSNCLSCGNGRFFQSSTGSCVTECAAL